MSRKPIVAVVALVIVLSTAQVAGAVVDPACAVDPSRLDPAARVAIWSSAIHGFIDDHPELTPAQLRVLSRAPGLIGGLRLDLSAKTERSRRATASLRAFMSDAQAMFSADELGDLLSRLGTLQVWLIHNGAFAESTPLCNCTGTGTCTFSGGPSGTCEDGCKTWTGDDGRRRDGLCTAVEVEVQ